MYLLGVERQRRTSLPARRPRGGRERSRFLLRHFSKEEIEAEIAGTNYGHYDGLVYNRQYADATVDNHLAAKGSGGIRIFWYYSLIDFPFQQSVLTGPWFDWLRTNIQFGGPVARVIRSRSGTPVVGLFRYYCSDTGPEYRELIDWEKITTGWHGAIIAKLIAESAPPGHLFFDMTWYGLSRWMVCDRTLPTPQGLCPHPPGTPTCLSGHGATAGGSPKYAGATWAEIDASDNPQLYTTNMRAFLAAADSEMFRRNGWTLKNGEDYADPWGGLTYGEPRFFENVGTGPPDWIDMAQVAEWRKDQRSVLEVKIPPHPYPLGESFNALRAVFQQYGGWVAVNPVGGELEEPAEGAGGTNMMQAYSLLASDL